MKGKIWIASVAACWLLLTACHTGKYKPAKNMARLEVYFADPFWNTVQVPPGQQCQELGGDGSTPSLTVRNVPPGANAIIMAFSDRNSKTFDNGGHGIIGYQIPKGEADVSIPSVPGYTEKLPPGFFLVRPFAQQAPWLGRGGAYKPPCQYNHRYYIKVQAVYDPSLKDAQTKTEIGEAVSSQVVGIQFECDGQPVTDPTIILPADKENQARFASIFDGYQMNTEWPFHIESQPSAPAATKKAPARATSASPASTAATTQDSGGASPQTKDQPPAQTADATTQTKGQPPAQTADATTQTKDQPPAQTADATTQTKDQPPAQPTDQTCPPTPTQEQAAVKNTDRIMDKNPPDNLGQVKGDTADKGRWAKQLIKGSLDDEVLEQEDIKEDYKLHAKTNKDDDDAGVAETKDAESAAARKKDNIKDDHKSVPKNEDAEHPRNDNLDQSDHKTDNKSVADKPAAPPDQIINETDTKEDRPIPAKLTRPTILAESNLAMGTLLSVIEAPNGSDQGDKQPAPTGK